jgi:methylated-DNA-[protein]-cysteine S-methyltransferase
MPTPGSAYYTLLSGLPEPLGELRLCSDGASLTRIDFAPLPGSDRPPVAPPSGQRADDLPVLRTAATQLREYFAGCRTEFTVPLALAGTPFQQAVWAQLSQIPYGATWSYAELARRIGNPQARRAVGAANGRNPVPIIVPCHRVIGHSGELTGYGGGLPRKQLLLGLEQRTRAPSRPLLLFAEGVC